MRDVGIRNQESGIKKDIYLDNNATTALEPSVLKAMQEVMQLPLNPSSTHKLGRKAHGILEAARGKIAALANAKNCNVIFTASGTEANNLAISGLAGWNVMVSAIEHPSVLKTAKNSGGIIVPATGEGVINTEALERLLKQQEKGKCLISVMLANNETGIIQPIKEVVRIAHQHGALVHTDAAQCFGKIAIDMEELGVDMITISAHKFGGPQGAAALIAKKNVPLHAIITGGGQEQGFRAGTQNVAAIHGFGVAAEIVLEGIESPTLFLAAGAPLSALQAGGTMALRDRLEAELLAFAPEVKIFGQNSERLPNTSCIAMPNVASETQLIHFDINGIAVSAGAACSSGKIEVSHVLRAMGVDDNTAKTAIRVSFGKNNTSSDVEAFISAWKELYSKVNDIKSAA
jgi:cysteine desulfurase